MNGRGVEKNTYETIRACIREGYSVPEAAELCDVSEATVYRATDDLRKNRESDKTERNERIVADILRGMTLRTAAAKYCLGQPAISKIMKRAGFRYNTSEHRFTRIKEDTMMNNMAEPVPAAEAEEKALMDINPTSRFRSVAISLESDCAKYRVLNNGSVTMSLMGMQGWITIPMEALQSLGAELIEISNRFGGLVNA